VLVKRRSYDSNEINGRRIYCKMHPTICVIIINKKNNNKNNNDFKLVFLVNKSLRNL